MCDNRESAKTAVLNLFVRNSPSPPGTFMSRRVSPGPYRRPSRPDNRSDRVAPRRKRPSPVLLTGLVLRAVAAAQEDPTRRVNNIKRTKDSPKSMSCRIRIDVPQVRTRRTNRDALWKSITLDEEGRRGQGEAVHVPRPAAPGRRRSSTFSGSRLRAIFFPNVPSPTRGPAGEKKRKNSTDTRRRGRFFRAAAAADPTPGPAPIPERFVRYRRDLHLARVRPWKPPAKNAQHRRIRCGPGAAVKSDTWAKARRDSGPRRRQPSNG